jgi:ABC-type multidrug transport system ATPase subunit
MEIQLSHIGKRYNREWIFRHVDYCFKSKEKHAIVGSNGSGKSTLLQIIAGALLHSEGEMTFTHSTNNEIIKPETVYQHIAYAAPYLELLEEMTAKEMFDFHSRFKTMTTDLTSVLNTVGLQNAQNKQIRYFSSGMKQRLKLGLAFFSDASILLLDEPTTNLDQSGIADYLQLISSQTQNRTVIICSNDKTEYSFCNHLLQIDQYKTASVVS